MPDWLCRAIIRDGMACHFNGPRNEMRRIDFRADLARVAGPALMLSGTLAACLQ